MRHRDTLYGLREDPKDEIHEINCEWTPGPAGSPWPKGRNKHVKNLSQINGDSRARLSTTFRLSGRYGGLLNIQMLPGNLICLKYSTIHKYEIYGARCSKL